jgi:hypothetical protein
MSNSGGLEANGNVGIGTSSPATLLQIGNGGEGWLNGLTIHSTSPSIYMRDSEAGQRTAMIHLNNNVLYFLGAPFAAPNVGNNWNTFPLTINMANNDAFFGGHVGIIGTLTMNAPYVNGIGSEFSLTAQNRSGGQSEWKILNMQGGGPYGGGLQIWSYPFDQQSYGGCCNYRFGITEDGRVNIGNVPMANTIGYKLAVNGNIISQKVKVTQTGWADYVFDPAYPLKSLEHVDSFISQYKHLPDVPSASEVEKDGIDLGDNQATLLRKIEELTLYMIDMNKKMKHQELVVKKQQVEIEVLQQKFSAGHK